MANQLALPTIPTPDGEQLPVAPGALQPSTQLQYGLNGLQAPTPDMNAGVSAGMPPAPLPGDPMAQDPNNRVPAAPVPAAVPSAGAALPPGQPPSAPALGEQPMAPAAPNLGSSLGELNRLQHTEHLDQAQANKAIDRVKDEKIKAANAQGQVDQAVAAENFKVQSDNLTKQNTLDQQALTTQAAITSRTNTQMGVVNTLTQQQAARTFDPERYDKSLGFAGKMMNSIGIALGAMSQSYTHSAENPGLTMYMKHRDDDIAAQKTQFEMGEKNLTNQNNIYAQFRQQGLDDQQATAAAKAVANEQAKNQIAVIGAKYGGAEAAAKKQTLLASLDGDSAKAHQEVQLGSHNQALAEINAKTSAREFELHQEQQRAALNQKAAKGSPITGEAAEKINANVGGIKALLQNASSFNDATNGPLSSSIPGVSQVGSTLGQLFGTSPTAKALNVRHDAAGALASTFDPGARNNISLIERAQDSTPDPRWTGHAAGIAHFKSQYEEARNNLMARIDGERGAGHNTAAIEQELAEMDQQAANLGLYKGRGVIQETKIAGGR